MTGFQTMLDSNIHKDTPQVVPWATIARYLVAPTHFWLSGTTGQLLISNPVSAA